MAGHVDITDSVVDAVEIVGVVGVFCHSAQFADQRFALSVGHHLGLQNTGIECQFVGRIHPDALLQRIIGLFLLAHLAIELSEQVIKACTLQFMCSLLNRSLQGFNSFPELSCGHVICGFRGLEFQLSAFADAVAPHLIEHIFCIVGPLEKHVAASQFGASHAGHIRLSGIESYNVVVTRSGLDEFSFLELSISEHQPGFLEGGVELMLIEVRLLFVTHASTGLLGLLLDAVFLDGFLALFYCGLEVSLADSCGLLVAHYEDGQDLVVVVYMPFFLGLDAFVECQAAIVEGVVASGNIMVAARDRGVLFRRTRSQPPCQE